MEKFELEKLIETNNKKIKKIEKTIYNPVLFSIAATGGISAFFSLCGLAGGVIQASELLSEFVNWVSIIGVVSVPIMIVGTIEINNSKKDDIKKLTDELNSAIWNLNRIIDEENKELVNDIVMEDVIVNTPSYTVSNVMSSTNNRNKVRSLIKKD